MKKKYIIGLAIIVVFVVFAMANLHKSLTPYVSLEEAKRTQETVQVKGERVAGSEYFDTERNVFVFKLVDDRGEECEVIYRGVKPANFEQADQVVAIGRFVNGKFEASQILVKCPSKYQAEGAKS
ncbi:MAG TPA: cytochrome c maturation protein CcmE [Bacteroidetes bacterium]|nr:cytochrome c maturation protein CcmE [Bacteroidota bacterium]